MLGESEDADEAIDVDVARVSACRLTDVRSAVSEILFTALVFSAGESSARGREYDPQLWQLLTSNQDATRVLGGDPASQASGGWCTDSGCYIWADPYDPMGGSGGGPGGGEGGGTGSSSGGSGPPPPPPAIPIMLVPDLEKVSCVGIAYGNKAPKWGFAFNNIWAFADGDVEAYSLTSSRPPTGFNTLFGDTYIGSAWAGGGTTILYAGAVTSHAGGFEYYDDFRNKRIAPGPFSSLGWAILTYAHEIMHQNGLGSTSDDELAAEGYAYSVLQEYRDDGGKKCR